MPALDFPSFYANIVEPYSVKISQQKRFNILFAEVNDDGELIECNYSSSLASRYTRGNEPLPGHFIEATCKLNTEKLEIIMQRLFQDPGSCKVAARDLVKNATLSPAAKKNFDKSYRSKNPYDFLIHVFVASLKCSSSLQPDFNSDNADPYFPTTSIANEYDIMYESSDFLSWLDANQIYHSPDQKAGYAIPYIKQYNLTLPQNLISLMYFAYRACYKADILGLDLEEFYNALYMDSTTMIIQTGNVQFYEISASNLAAAGSIISSADIPMADRIIINIYYDSNSPHQAIRNIETAIRAKACRGAKIYKSISISDSLPDCCCIEMLFHVPQPT